MKFILFFSFFSFNMICWAQSDTILIVYPKKPQLMEVKKTDTLLINSSMDGQILYGTMAIPETGFQIALWSYSGLRLQSVTGSDCSGEQEGIIERVESVVKNDSMWIISTQI